MSKRTPHTPSHHITAQAHFHEQAQRASDADICGGRTVNWQALGAVGEIVGAAAVVASLLYLARQTKKNAQELDATSSREFTYRLSDWHREAARDPELKRIIMKSVSLEPEDYTGAEWFEFRLAAISLFTIYETGFVHMSLDVGNREQSTNHMANARSVIDSFPAWRRFWDEEASTGAFTKGFMEAINSATRTGDFRFMVESKQAQQTH